MNLDETPLSAGLMARTVDDPAVAAIAALFAVHRVLSEGMDRELRRVSGLSTAQVEVLVVLGNAPDRRMRMADIARAVCVSRSGTTQIVDRLVRAGLAARVVGVEDRRTVWAAATEAGREALRVTRPVFEAQARLAVAGLDHDRVSALRDTLLALVGEEHVSASG